MFETWTLTITGPALHVLIPVAIGLIVRGVLGTIEDISTLAARLVRRRTQPSK